MSVRIRPVRPTDHVAWRELFAGYAGFYRTEQTEQMAERVWSWLHDPRHEVQGLVAEDTDGTVVAIAHYRPFARPLDSSTGCFLDDLFVDPDHRGGGTVDALLAELRRLARQHGWTVVRWITQEDNYRARAAYDRVAARTDFLTYDMPPAG